MPDSSFAQDDTVSGSLFQPSETEATSMTLAAVILGLALTETMSAADQNAVANLLFAAAQAISTRASLMPQNE